MGLNIRTLIRTICCTCLIVLGSTTTPLKLSAQQAPTDITVPDGLLFPGDMGSYIEILDAPEIRGTGNFSVEFLVDFGIVNDDEYLFSTAGDWLNEGLTLKTYNSGLELTIGDSDGAPEYLNSASALLSTGRFISARISRMASLPIPSISPRFLASCFRRCTKACLTTVSKLSRSGNLYTDCGLKVRVLE